MRLRYRDHPDLPPLAWLAEISLPDGQITVLKGQDVEAAADFFVEGAWNGSFDDGGFDQTDIFFGSGMRLRGDEVIFVPSCATVDALHYHADEDHLLVSNSLPCLLAARGDRLDPRCDRYVEINDSITAGIDAYHPEIPTVKGAVRRQLYRNLVLSKDGLGERDKPMSPAFPDFESYRAYVRLGLLAVIENAESSGRRTPMKVLSSQSRGYDSTAINSLIPPRQVEAVFTIPSSRKPGHDSRKDEDQEADDSGEDICRYLGMSCQLLDKYAATQDAASEALCFSTLHTGEDENLFGLTQVSHGPAIYVSGVHGDVVWASPDSKYSKGAYIAGTLKRGDTSLAGFTEVRLAGGLVQVGAAFIGARSHESIARISASEDMLPWRLGTTYDKPIARRIAEEAGVPRMAFGQKKMATAVAYGHPPIPRNADLRRAFFRFLMDNGLASRLTLRLMPVWTRINEVIHFHTPTRNRALYYLEQLIGRITGKPFRFPYLLSRLNGTLFCYCVNQRADFYAERLTTAGQDSAGNDNSTNGIVSCGQQDIG